MGIVNVTPDSFADGGRRLDTARAVADGLQMISDGADILDIGGESTRPGADPVTADEELRRVLPVVEALAGDLRVPVSDRHCTRPWWRARRSRGARRLSTTSAASSDHDGLAAVVAASGAAIVLMHNRGRSRDMYREAVYDDVVGEIVRELEAAIGRAVAAGIPRESVMVDPGLGFAKRAEHAGIARRARPAGGARLPHPRRALEKVVPHLRHRRPTAIRSRLGHRRGRHRRGDRRRAHRPGARGPRDGRRGAGRGSSSGRGDSACKLQHG